MGMLNWVSILNDLSTGEKMKLEEFCQEKNSLEWELLFKEWDDASAMYFVLEGEIEILQKTDYGTRTLAVALKWDMVGEMALFGWEKIRMATAITKKEARLVTILSFSIEGITAKYPEVLKKIQNIISNRIEKNKNH